LIGLDAAAQLPTVEALRIPAAVAALRAAKSCAHTTWSFELGGQRLFAGCDVVGEGKQNSSAYAIEKRGR
jgi:hypothetical protein